MLRRFGILVCVVFGVSYGAVASAQSFGIELHNSLMPASGAMGGASLSRPQDLQSAINGNPATLTQFRGTQVSFGGAWAEPTYKINQTQDLPLVGVMEFDEKSGTPGALIPNIGITQDFGALGLPATLGIGFVGNAGAGTDFRDVPASGGTSVEYLALDLIVGLGVDVTDRLSVGTSIVLGNSFLDGPFVDLGGMTPAYALRGGVGVNYTLSEYTSVGAYWQTRKSFTFEDAVLFSVGPAQSIKLDHPQNLGVGLANSSLMNGRLLLAMDVLYIQNSDAAFLKAIYNDQWVWQFGMQYRCNRRLKLRLGYAYNDNPMRQNVGGSAGGVAPPAGVPAVRYVQGQFAAISQHRITGGAQIANLLPGVDLDIFAGGMFENTDQFSTTIATVESYWAGVGLTWRFGRGACERLPAPDQWGG
jgi:long-chain fatty acid transport protein